MAMLRICSADGCDVKTMGEYCLQHEKALPLLDRRMPAPVAAVRTVSARRRVPAAA
jgi:hypothetical protein